MSWCICILIFLCSQSFLDGCWGFISGVESAISDAIHLPASMAAVCCVFRQLATRAVEIQLVKLSVGGVTQTKTKTDIPTWNTHSKVKKLSVALFFRETSELSMFPNYLQTYHRILCFSTAWTFFLHSKDDKKDTVFFYPDNERQCCLHSCILQNIFIFEWTVPLSRPITQVKRMYKSLIDSVNVA